jgi:DNA invertase Pin-like site-specific DNA recombinase
MKVIGYSRVSSSQQDVDKQQHLILTYALKHNFHVEDLISIEISSKASKEKRRINELIESLNPGDLLITAELSRLGRDMLQTLNIINELAEKEIDVIFIRQPELSTHGGRVQSKLLLAIYSYFAETERNFIALRTKQGLEAAKARGVQLGRPKGSSNRSGYRLDPYKDQILELKSLGLKARSIMKIINPLMEEPVSLSSFERYLK